MNQQEDRREQFIFPNEPVVFPRSEQAHAGVEERRRPSEHGVPHTDDEVNFNPETRPQSSKARSEASIQSYAGARFKDKRAKLTTKVEELERNSDVHTEELEERIQIISRMFNTIDIETILEWFVYYPNTDDQFGGSSDSLAEWHADLEERIQNLQIKAKKQIAVRKSVTTSGFEKKAYPRYDGTKLDYYVFKNRWFKEVSIEHQHPDRELASLRECLCQSAKNKVIDCNTLKEVWEVLDKYFGNLQELRAALKLKISQIKLKSQSSPHCELELFNEIQFLTVKVKAHGGENSLKYDQEYVAMLT